MVCSSIKYYHDTFLKVIKHLHIHCFSVVINENEPALIIDSKLDPLICDN